LPVPRVPKSVPVVPFRVPFVPFVPHGVPRAAAFAAAGGRFLSEE